MTPCPACESETPTTSFVLRDVAWRTTPGEFRYARCERCGTVFADPPADDETLAAAYPATYHAGFGGWQQRVFSAWEHREARRLVRAVGPLNALALDVGCGAGSFLASLRDEGWPGPVRGIDTSPHASRRAAERGITVDVGTLETVAPAEGSVGLLVMRHVIEHIERPREALRHAWRLLEPDGHLYVTAPNPASLGADLLRGAWIGYDAPRHLATMPADTLERAIADCGFEILRTWRDAAPEELMVSLRAYLSDGGRRAVVDKTCRIYNPVFAVGSGALALAEVATRRTSVHGVLARRRAAPA